jgi:peptidoglycan/xylan/chitin deacetylase (PgdA/CDA1 family)
VVADFLKRVARHAAALLTVGTRLRRVAGKDWALVLRYHRVTDEPVPLAVTVREFAAQVRFLRARCRLVTAGEVAASVAAGEPLLPRSVAITFDDGYEDNFTEALPVLQRYAAQATFFLTAGWIGTGKMLWWDKLHDYIRQAAELGARPQDYERLPRPVAAVLARADLRTRATVARFEGDLVAALRELDLSPEELDDRVEHIAASLGAEEARDELYRPMSWDQVRQLRAAGMEIGSHTMTHARLPIVPVERAFEELEQSRKTIGRELGQPVSLLAYPAGEHSRDAIDLVTEAGYEGAYTTASGPVRAGDDPFRLRRIGVWTGGYRGAFGLFSPSVFGLQISRLARQAAQGQAKGARARSPEKGTGTFWAKPPSGL